MLAHFFFLCFLHILVESGGRREVWGEKRVCKCIDDVRKVSKKKKKIMLRMKRAISYMHIKNNQQCVRLSCEGYAMFCVSFSVIYE